MVFRKNRKMAKLNASAGNCFFNGAGPQKLSSGAGESLIFMFFLFFRKKNAKKMSSNFAKIELSFEPELNFCNFWGLQNEPPKAL